MGDTWTQFGDRAAYERYVAQRKAEYIKQNQAKAKSTKRTKLPF